MPPTVAELLQALPAEPEQQAVPEPQLQELLSKLSARSVPTGALHRLWKLGGVSATIGLAYLIYWTRSWFRGVDARNEALLETHLAAALRLLETMAYLRGAIMKLGQTAASFPEVVPDEFVETLSKLHFEAPSMHFSLLREHVHNELGADPEDLFDRFETTAFAAASLGQVHRARLKSGENVAVKIQYPGIGRTIRSDFRNLGAFLFPLRGGPDWENLQSQFDEIRRMFEQETDYEQEAEFLRRARSLFREDDGIVVPRVYEQFSTRRVLTMEYIDGRNFYEFIRSEPEQELRNHFGSQILRSAARMLYAGRMEYGDPHPGNYLFLDDGRLGLVDFGCVRTFSEDEWEYMRLADAAAHGTRDQVVDAILRGTDFSRQELTDLGIVDLMVDYCRWIWTPFTQDGPFDYGDRSHIDRGISIIKQFTSKARVRQKPVNVFVQRALLAGWGLQYRLRSVVDAKAICVEEVRVTGWRL